MLLECGGRGFKYAKSKGNFRDLDQEFIHNANKAEYEEQPQCYSIRKGYEG